MKRTFAKQSLLSLLAGFFLFGFMLLTAARAEAQTQNWKPGPEAQGDLLDKVTLLGDDLQLQQPGSYDYNETLIRMHYYKEIYRRIDIGTTVQQSVTDALNIFPTAQGFSASQDVAGLVVDKAKKQILQSEAADLLTN